MKLQATKKNSQSLPVDWLRHDTERAAVAFANLLIALFHSEAVVTDEMTFMSYGVWPDI